MTKIAAAQFAPMYMDLKGSLEKAVNLIAEARAGGSTWSYFLKPGCSIGH